MEPNNRDAVFAAISLLERDGPNVGRPAVDTIHGSKYKNLKELRVQSSLSVFRLFFIFDPLRNAVVLCGGDKRGKDEKLFYKSMIRFAEKTYEQYLSRILQEKNEQEI